MAVHKVLQRSKRSFLSRHHKRATDYGKIVSGMMGHTGSFADMVIVESDSESTHDHHGHGHGQHKAAGSTDSPSLDSRPSKDGGDSFGRHSSSTINGDDDHALHPPEIQKRRTVMQKLRLHK